MDFSAEKWESGKRLLTWNFESGR